MVIIYVCVCVCVFVRVCSTTSHKAITKWMWLLSTVYQFGLATVATTCSSTEHTEYKKSKMFMILVNTFHKFYFVWLIPEFPVLGAKNKLRELMQ